MLVRVVYSEQRSGKSSDLAEADEERFMDLSLRVDKDSAVKHDHSSDREDGCRKQLYVRMVFHVSILFVSPACYAGLGGFVNCPRIACGFGFHRPVCGMPSRFSQIRCKSSIKKRTHQKSEFAERKNLTLFSISGQIIPAILRKMFGFGGR